MELNNGPSAAEPRRRKRRAAGAVLIGLALVAALIGISLRRTVRASFPPGGTSADLPRGAVPASFFAFAGVPGWDWIAAERRARRDVDLAPEGAAERLRLGDLLIRTGRFDAGLDEMERARKLDPASSEINEALAFGYYWARRFDQALAAHRRTLKADPGFVRARLGIALADLQRGKAEEALAEALAAVDPQSDSAEEADLGYVFAAAGKRDLALKIAERLAGRGDRAAVAPDLAYHLGVIYAALGLRDPAFAWFEKAYAGTSPAMAVLKIDPRLDDLRGDPRYLDLVKRLRFPEE